MRDTEFYVSHYFTWFHPANDIAWPRCPSKIDKLCDASECINCAHLRSTLCLTVWLDIVSWVPCGVHEKPFEKAKQFTPFPQSELASSGITGVVSFNSISWHVCFQAKLWSFNLFLNSLVHFVAVLQPFQHSFQLLVSKLQILFAFLESFCQTWVWWSQSFRYKLPLLIAHQKTNSTRASFYLQQVMLPRPQVVSFLLPFHILSQFLVVWHPSPLSPLVTCSMLHQKIPERCQIWKYGSKIRKKVQPQLAQTCWCEPKVRITDIDTKCWGFLVTSRDGDLDLSISFDFGAYAKHPLHILHLLQLSPWPFWLSSCFGSFGADHFAVWNRNLNQKLVASIWLPLWFLARRWTCQKSLASVRGCQCPMA